MSPPPRVNREPVPGRPCIGSWLSYGLGSLNEDLPTFVVMTSTHTYKANVQAISARMWSCGFLPARHAGVSLRCAGDPVLYLSDPDGVTGRYAAGCSTVSRR